MLQGKGIFKSEIKECCETVNKTSYRILHWNTNKSRIDIASMHIFMDLYTYIIHFILQGTTDFSLRHFIVAFLGGGERGGIYVFKRSI